MKQARHVESQENRHIPSKIVWPYERLRYDRQSSAEQLPGPGGDLLSFGSDLAGKNLEARFEV